MQKQGKQRLHEENMTSKQIQVSGVATFEIALSRRFPCSASTAGMESRSVNSSSEQATTSNTFIICALRIPSFILPNSFKVIQAEHGDSGLAESRCGRAAVQTARSVEVTVNAGENAGVGSHSCHN